MHLKELPTFQKKKKDKRRKKEKKEEKKRNKRREREIKEEKEKEKKEKKRKENKRKEAGLWQPSGLERQSHGVLDISRSRLRIPVIPKIYLFRDKNK